MYKLLNKLFGWDYVRWQNYSDACVTRVRLDAWGRPYCIYGNFVTIRITDSNKFTWLTCKPEKYLK